MFGDLCKWIICMFLQYNTIMLCFYVWKCFSCTEISFKKNKQNRKYKMRIFHLHSVKEKERPIFPISHFSSFCPPISSSIKTWFLSHTQFSFLLFGDIRSFHHFVPSAWAIFPGRVFAGGLELGFGLSSKAERGVFKLRGSGARLPVFESGSADYPLCDLGQVI